MGNKLGGRWNRGSIMGGGGFRIAKHCRLDVKTKSVINQTKSVINQILNKKGFLDASFLFANFLTFL